MHSSVYNVLKKRVLWLGATAAYLAFAERAGSAQFQITGFSQAGALTWSNAFPSGVCTVETTGILAGTNSWQPKQNFFTTNSTGGAVVSKASSNLFVRLLAVDISPSAPPGYTNLLQSYGRLHTIAGTGVGGIDGVNYWQPQFEGGYATNAALSRPHMAMADDAGNIFVVDKDSHSVLKITPNGRIHTVAGTHVRGFNGAGPAPATGLQLNTPNGLHVFGDGTFFILDIGNGRVCRVSTNGTMTTVFTVPGGISVGRGLWVDDDQQTAFICDHNMLKMWTPTNGVTILNTNFVDLGNLILSSKQKNVIVTDRGDDKVYKVDISGSGIGGRSLLYGKGHGLPVVDGTLALTNCFNGVRGVWRLPTDGYLFALHEGDQVLYVDPADVVHVFVNGQSGAHSGDNQWFHSPGYKITQARSVTMDSQGNILIVESDFGYIRKIDFQRLTP